MFFYFSFSLLHSKQYFLRNSWYMIPYYSAALKKLFNWDSVPFSDIHFQRYPSNVCTHLLNLGNWDKVWNFCTYFPQSSVELQFAVHSNYCRNILIYLEIIFQYHLKVIKSVVFMTIFASWAGTLYIVLPSGSTRLWCMMFSGDWVLIKYFWNWFTRA